MERHIICSDTGITFKVKKIYPINFLEKKLFRSDTRFFPNYSCANTVWRILCLVSLNIFGCLFIVHQSGEILLPRDSLDVMTFFIYPYDSYPPTRRFIHMSDSRPLVYLSMS